MHMSLMNTLYIGATLYYIPCYQTREVEQANSKSIVTVNQIIHGNKKVKAVTLL